MARKERVLEFNDCPGWQAVCATYEGVIAATAGKMCQADTDMQEDAKNEARIALYCVRPERIKRYDPSKHGPITPDSIPSPVDNYCRNVIRNSVISLLTHRSKGRWDIGQTTWRKDKSGHRLHEPSRYTSLEELVSLGAEFDRRGTLSWTELSTDGLLLDEVITDE